MVERGSGIAVGGKSANRWRTTSATSSISRANSCPRSPSSPPFAVNRHTIRRAMGELEQSGLIRIEQGRGTFVQEHAIDYAIGKRTRFSENLRSQGVWATWKRWAARRCAPPTSRTWPAAQRASCARVSGGQGRKPAHQRVRTLLRPALSRFRRTPDRAKSVSWSMRTTASTTTRANGRASRRRALAAARLLGRRALSCRSRR